MSHRSVLVAGATGQQGGAVADALLSGKYGEFDVHALTRSPDSDRAQALANRGATLVEGNLLHKDSFRPAVEGVDAVFCVTTHGEDAFAAEIEQGTNMAEVAADTGITHFVFSSIYGAEHDTGIPHWDSKYEIEQRIRALDLPATTIRLVAFMELFELQREAILNGTLAFPVAEGVPMKLVHPRDIGALVATVLATPEEYIGEIIELVSDEHTLESAAEVFADVTDTAVDAQHLSPEAARQELPEIVVPGFEWHNEHFEETSEDRDRNRDLAIEPTQLETYLCEHGWVQ